MSALAPRIAGYNSAPGTARRRCVATLEYLCLALVVWLTPLIAHSAPTLETAQRIAALSPSMDHLNALNVSDPRLVDGTCVSFALHSLLAQKGAPYSFEEVAAFAQSNFITLGMANGQSKGVLSTLGGIVPAHGVPVLAAEFGLRLKSDWTGRLREPYPSLIARWLDEGRGVLATVRASRLYELPIYLDDSRLAGIGDAQHVVRVATYRRGPDGQPSMFYIIDINRGNVLTAIPASHLDYAARNKAELLMVAWRTLY
jgi:hypothetical protein